MSEFGPRSDPKKEIIFSARKESKEEKIERFATEEMESLENPAGLAEIAEFKEDIRSVLRAKAEALGADNEEEIENCIRYLEKTSGIELEHLEEYDLTPQELETTRCSMEEGIRKIKAWDDERIEETISGAYRWNPGYLGKTPYSKDFFEKVEEVARRKVVPLGMLTLYLSSFGSAFLKELAGSETQLEWGRQKITLKELAENPELMKKIDQAHNTGTPLDIVMALDSVKAFEGKDSGGDAVKFSFGIKEEARSGGQVEKIIFIDNYEGNVVRLENLQKDLHGIGVSLDPGGTGCSYQDMEKKADLIGTIFTQDLKLPPAAVAAYLENFLHPQGYEDIGVVGLEEFRTEAGAAGQEDPLKLNHKLQEIYKEHNVSVNSPREDIIAAQEEFKAWGQANGYPDATKAVWTERENYEDSPQKSLRELQEGEYRFVDDFDNDPGRSYMDDEQFREDVIQALEEDGYTIDELKQIGQDDPEQVIKILGESLGKKFHYDWSEMLVTLYNGLVWDLIGSEDFLIHHYMDKHKEGTPSQTLESGYGVCHDFAMTMVAAKEVLEAEGVPVQKVFLGCTISDTKYHEWNVAATVDADGEVKITYLDATWMNSFLKEFKPLDVVGQGGEGHYYNVDMKLTVEEKAKKDMAILWLEDQIKQFLSQEKVMEELKAKDFRRQEAKEEKKTESLLQKLRKKIRLS